MTCLSPPILTGHFCRHFPCNHEYNILQFRLINHIKIITNQATMRLFNILQNLDNADSGTKKTRLRNSHHIPKTKLKRTNSLILIKLLKLPLTIRRLPQPFDNLLKGPIVDMEIEPQPGSLPQRFDLRFLA